MNETRQIELAPNWKSWFWFWLVTVLLLPVFGIGLLTGIYTWRKMTAVRFHVRDHSLTRITRQETEEIELSDIQSTNVHQSRIEQKLNVGTVMLYVGPRMIEMPGMVAPHRLSETIRTAAEAARQTPQKQEVEPNRQPEAAPGTLDRIDYLTGLWQQGLISDADYRREKRHFESGDS